MCKWPDLFFSPTTPDNMKDIKLNFINKSNDANNTEVVIFQKNTAPSAGEAVAWTVIQNCGFGDHHPFTYPIATTISASDPYGNYTPELSAENGQLFHMVLTASGDVLQMAPAPGSPNEIALRNDLAHGSINANLYKAGRLLATKTSIAPQQKAVFRFEPALFIGAVSEVQQGEIMPAAIVSEINTELSLNGIASADIVMTGGGPGAGATPFQFSLENIVYQ